MITLWYIGLAAGSIAAITGLAWLIYAFRKTARDADEYDGIEHPPVRTQIWRDGKHDEF